MKKIKNYKKSEHLKMTFNCRACECYYETDELYYREAIEISQDKKELKVLVMAATCPMCNSVSRCGENETSKLYKKLLKEVKGKTRKKVHGNTKRKIKQI